MDHAQHGRAHDVTLPGLLRDSLALTKPGIIAGNLLSVTGGFCLGSSGPPDLFRWLVTASGIGLMVASACVFNNCIDQDIDARMRRTCRRPLPAGRFPLQGALALGAVLAISGILMIKTLQSPWTLGITLAGFLVYVGLYTSWLKRHSPWATWVGSLAGAAPPLAGYCAMGHVPGLEGGLLLAAFCLWQIPHSDAIALLHEEDYRMAGVCVLPVSHGANATMKRIRRLILPFALLAFALLATGSTNPAFPVLALLLNGYWLWLALRPASRNARLQARQLLQMSLVSVMALNLGLVVECLMRISGP